MIRDIFAQRLITLRENSGISQQQLAEAVGVTRQSLSLYEQSKRTIDIDLLSRIATYFNVTSDYLLGLSDTPSPDIEDQAICKKLGIEGETLEALKRLFGTVHNCDDSTKTECSSQDSASIISELLVKSLVEIPPLGKNSFFDEIKAYIKKYSRYASLSILQHQAKTTLENYAIKSIKGDDIDEAIASWQADETYVSLEEYLFDITEKVLDIKDSLDASEWRLQKSASEILRMLLKECATRHMFETSESKGDPNGKRD